MKKNIFSILAALSVLMLVSCDLLPRPDAEKDSYGLTGMTYYADIQLNGDNPYVVSLGEPFVDPGYTATLQGKDVTSQVIVNSNVNTETFGVYSVTYNVVNPDGFTYLVVRDVYVLNPGHIDNLYVSNCRMGNNNFKNITIVINKVREGVYEIEDLCGGYYFAGRYPGYEPTYNFHATTRFSINEDNTIQILDYDSWYFVKSFDYENFEGTYDPETGILDYYFDGIYATLVPFSV